MTYVVLVISTFINSAAVLMALVLMLSLVHRGGRSRWKNKAIMGGMFSVAVLVSMADPIVLPQDAGNIDMRGLLVGTSAALFGPIVGTITLMTALAFRLFIGGAGMMPGLMAIAISFAMGLLWHVFIKDKPIVTFKKSLTLGVMLSLQTFAVFLMPEQYWAHMFINLAPFIVMSNIVGALIINHLLSGELSFLSEAEASKLDANTDHLTGLLNRRGLELIYPDFLESRNRACGQALLCFDIDWFKVTNDTYGHAVGDDVLRFVVDQVAANLRQKDTFVRLGGDEFVVVLPDIEPAEAKAIGERCRSVIAESGFEVNCKVVPLSISVGAVWSGDSMEIDALISYADKALYQAKEKGRNSVVFVGADMGGIPAAA